MLRHVLFDLDETLYPRHNPLMHMIRQRILDYLTERMGLDRASALDLRHHYFLSYGTTLRGLQVEQNVDPYDYLAFVHNVRHAEVITPDPRLRAVLEGIPQPKHIFTNADAAHASKTLEALGVGDLFERIFDIVFFAWEPKPAPNTYRRALAALGIQPFECAIVEDLPQNLPPARALGLKTVLVDAEGEADRRIDSIYQVAEALASIDGQPNAG